MTFSAFNTKMRFMLMVMMALAGVVCLAMPAGAVLPPGAHEGMAADAPVVVIGQVVKVRDLGEVRLADCKILAKMRGTAEVGSVIEVEAPFEPLPCKRHLMGPSVEYHNPTAGQVWLLLLHNPNPRVAKAAPILAAAYSFVSYGWYTQRLDNLSGSVQLMALAPNGVDGDVAKIRDIYRWAGAWLDKQLRR